MNDRLAIVVLALVGACCGPSRPLSEAILGEWEVLCRTDKESTATCLGKEEDGLYKHAIGDVAYALALPAGYRLARDDNNRQQWAPTSGLGFTVLLTLSPRAQTLVDGEFVTPPCNDFDYGGVSGSGSTIDGVERSTSIGTSLCLEGSEQVLMCSTEHTRGYLEDPEKDGALALCKSLVVTRQGPSTR